MEKRVLIAVLLSIAVLYGYSMLVPQPQKKMDEVKPPPAKQTTMVQDTSAITAVPSPAALAAGFAKDVTVDTDLYTAIFSSRGGTLRKIVLKKYKDAAGSAGKEIALIDENTPDNFTLKSTAKGFVVDPSAIFTVNSDGFKVSKGEKRELEFTWSSPQGTLLKKTYIIHGDSFAIDLKEQLANTGAARQDGVLQLVLNNRIDPKGQESSTDVYGPVTLADNSLKSEKLKDLAKAPVQLDKNILWTGFGDKYFLRAVLAQDSSIAAVQVLQTPSNRIENIISSPNVSLNPGQVFTVSYKVYFGPKDLDILKAQGNRLEEVIDFGWFSALAKPLLYTLKYFYKYTHNYGVAIIIITIILKVLFFPLTHKSYKSMKEMQKIQPKMVELKEKFKNDRDAMNRAVMELYKTHKVNPLGGCLPMIVQIPVFFALYKALMFSIELRHAPFIFWIQDLSAKDPYYVTPIIMGVTMFVQQKMTPSNMDPMQQKMMLALPVVFTFMFLNFPSGLVLYWLVNNILTIAQQMYINKSLQES
ncbi:MAG: preprotein translocase subunit [Geobacteraceae bacterium]|nr:MAG: preprotein translocase subunit [Geobacteraceae bacterium]